MGYRVGVGIGNTRRVASKDRPPLIRPSTPTQRSKSTPRVSLTRQSGPAEPIQPIQPVDLVKRGDAVVRRVDLRKSYRPTPLPPLPGPRRGIAPLSTRVLVAAAAAASTGAARGARATRAWAGRPSGRMVLPGLLMAVLVAVATMGGAWLPRATGAEPVGAAPEQSAPPSTGEDAPGGEDKEDVSDPLLPSGTGASRTPGAGGPASDTLAAWAAPMSVRTTIPLVALQAYALAELAATQRNPGCNLRWTTLAGIGRNESNHGRSGNATLSNDGKSTPPIYGPPLDGTANNRAIPDTDQGRLDGDSTWDRAIGPMQFIPSTWTKYAVDADGDGTSDPHDIDDAALASANYLCAGGRNLATAEGWWGAILAYNNVQTYAQNVFNAANDYGIRSRA
jgi:membrane-bound lytic murein transglycosylase B